MGEGVPVKEQPALMEIGHAEVTRKFAGNKGRKVALFGLGNMHHVAEQTAELLLAEGFDCAVINPRFTKPLDAGTHEFFARAAEAIVTLEDHVLPGGYGASVLELLNEKGISTPVARIGWPDQFIEHATHRRTSAREIRIDSRERRRPGPGPSGQTRAGPFDCRRIKIPWTSPCPLPARN